MARAAKERLPTAGSPREDDAKLIRGARGPHASEISTEFVHTQRGVTLVLIEETEGFDEAALILLSELSERLKELCREVQGPVGLLYRRALRGRRFLSRLGNRPRSKSCSLSRYTRPARMSSRARRIDVIDSSVYAHASSAGTTRAGRSVIRSSSTPTSS